MMMKTTTTTTEYPQIRKLVTLKTDEQETYTHYLDGKKIEETIYRGEYKLITFYKTDNSSSSIEFNLDGSTTSYEITPEGEQVNWMGGVDSKYYFDREEFKTAKNKYLVEMSINKEKT